VHKVGEKDAAATANSGVLVFRNAVRAGLEGDSVTERTYELQENRAAKLREVQVRSFLSW